MHAVNVDSSSNRSEILPQGVYSAFSGEEKKNASHMAIRDEKNVSGSLTWLDIGITEHQSRLQQPGDRRSHRNNGRPEEEQDLEAPEHLYHSQ